MQKVYFFKNVIIILTKHLPRTFLAISVEFIWSEICLKTHKYGSGSIRVNFTSKHDMLTQC